MTCTEERFLGYVTAHEMRVMRDDGLYRHIKFRKPEECAYWFDLITWPGHLCINGDCGSYVFARTPDMFEFFRDERTARDGKLHINKSYWAEKLKAQDCHGKHCEGVKRWSSDEFERAIKRRYIEHVRSEMSGEPAKRKELRRLVEENVLRRSDEQHYAIDAACGFDEHGLRFEDFWEVDCTEWDFSFVWSLYAIQWGIRRYDAAKAEQKAA